MRVTMSLQSQRSNLCWKIFYCQFSRISKNKLKTDFNVILSCEPDDGSYRNVIFSCEPDFSMNPLTAPQTRRRRVRYVASVFKCKVFSEFQFIVMLH